MIQSEELRIGNVIFINDSLRTVEGIVGDQVWFKKEKHLSQDLIINCNPVPLTEGWLLRMGFTIVPAPSAYGFDCNHWSEKYLLRGAWNGSSWFAYEILNNGTHKEFKFVHELQDLYRALTGTKLTIKG